MRVSAHRDRPVIFANLQSLVRVYVRKNKPKLDSLLQDFRCIGSLEEAVRIAASGRTLDGKRHPHQRRVSRKALAAAGRILTSATAQIAPCGSFEQLLALVTAKTDAITGFGELAQYDTALRIGAFMGVYPEKVYLHAGTRKGAIALGFRAASHALELADLPAPLRVLAPCEAEDFLCIYKDRLFFTAFT